MITGADIQAAYMATLQADTDLQAWFPSHGTAPVFPGIVQEDPGGVSPQQSQVLASTIVYETNEDQTTGTGQRQGGKALNVVGLALVLYIYDRNRTAEIKTRLVQLTGQLRWVCLRYRSDPDPSRQMWYLTRFAGPRGTAYRKTEAHQQAIVLIEIYNEERVL